MRAKNERGSSLGKLHPLIVDPTRIIYYKHGRILSLDLRTSTSSLICRMKMPAYKKAFSFLRITERTLRLEPRCTARISDDEFILSYSGSVYCVNEKTKQCTPEHRYRDGMSNALQFVAIRGVRGFEDAVVYGEYWQNANREPVRIFARKSGTWSVVYTFPQGSVKHIHGMIPDPGRGCVYILTGDEDRESGIWTARNGFLEVEPLLTGKKEYRSCVGLADESGLIFATDNPYETNHVRFVGIAADGTATDIRDLAEINGPCIYGTEWNGKLVLSTSVEQDYSIKRGRLASIFSRKLGGGTKTDHSVVYVGDLQNGFSELVRFQKDLWPMGLCALGTVQFPVETDRGALCLYPVAVKRVDGHAMLFHE